MGTLGIADLSYLEKSLSSFRIDETGTYTYVGYCLPEDYLNVDEPVWQIIRFDSTNGEGGQFASNQSDPNKVWNARASYF